VIDIINVMQVNQNRLTDRFINENMDALKLIQNSNYCELFVKMIFVLSKKNIISDDTLKTLIEIYYNDLSIFLAKKNNKKYAFQNISSSKRSLRNANDECICSICLERLNDKCILCLSCDKYITCVPCFDTVIKTSIKCIRCRN
jgi:hypothetical protein